MHVRYQAKKYEQPILMPEAESQNFLDPGLRKPQSQVKLGFYNTDLG